MTRLSTWFCALVFWSGCLFSSSGTPTDGDADAGPVDASTSDVRGDDASTDDVSRNSTQDCPQGQLFCDDGCTPVAADTLNCGECGNDCDASAPPGAHTRGCAASVCVFECDAGLADDDGDLQLPGGNGCESDCVASDEVCDGIDNDCDGETDEELTEAFYFDGDGDGAGNPMSPSELCPNQPDPQWVPNDDDCDDERDDRAPGLEESCDAIDNDCDGEIDEGLLLDYFFDMDGDGFGGPMSQKFCDIPPPDYVLDGGDCDDDNPLTYPQADEICDGEDNDCDAATQDATDSDCVHTIFVTSGQFPSNFNRNDLADNICAASGLNISNSRGNWRAIISTPTENAIDRILQVGAIRDVQGNVLWQAGELFNSEPMGAVNVKEDATSLGFGDEVEVWTGTQTGGLSGASCSGFTVVSEFEAGVSGSAIESSQWVQATSGNCMGEQRIYCIDGQP